VIDLNIKIEVTNDLKIHTNLFKKYTPHEGYDPAEEKAAAGLEAALGVLFEKAFQQKSKKMSNKLKEGKLSELYSEASDYVIEKASKEAKKIQKEA